MSLYKDTNTSKPPLLNEKALIESLEHYGTPENYSDENRRKYCRCCVICRSSLDHINRQKAEIERLCKENEILSVNADTSFQDGLNEAQDLYAEQIKNEIRVEVIKEFAERLCKDRVSNDPVVIAVKVELEMEKKNEYI